MEDMRKVTEPKSDQWNFDDFQAGPMTFTIEAVKVKGGQEQPVEITLAGTPKFYRPCKSMSRCLVAAWGPDSSKYVGRSLTLYGDPKIKWGGLEVGGIRISHMSDIESSMTMALTVTRANKKPFTVKPLAVTGASKAAAIGDVGGKQPVAESSGKLQDEPPVTAAAPITADEALKLEARCTDNGIAPAKVKKKFGVTLFGQLTSEQLAEAHKLIDITLAEREAA